MPSPEICDWRKGSMLISAPDLQDYLLQGSVRRIQSKIGECLCKEAAGLCSRQATDTTGPITTAIKFWSKQPDPLDRFRCTRSSICSVLARFNVLDVKYLSKGEKIWQQGCMEPDEGYRCLARQLWDVTRHFKILDISYPNIQGISITYRSLLFLNPRRWARFF